MLYYAVKIVLNYSDIHVNANMYACQITNLKYLYGRIMLMNPVPCALGKCHVTLSGIVDSLITTIQRFFIQAKMEQ